MKQKKYMNISRVKLGDESSPGNVGGFEVGDLIQISEKWDGANASIQYDIETGKLVAFSRNSELSEDNKLGGFWNYVQKLNVEAYKSTPNYVIFGEWGIKHAIEYKPEAYRRWYVYDIYDIEKEGYLTQEEVKQFTEQHGLLYIHVLYEGEFISWEHCMTFCNSPAYGDKQEGIVIKNQTKINIGDNETPFVLKIVNDAFAEIKKENRKRKIADLNHKKEKEEAQNIVDMIVTKRRVEKQLYKMRDEGIISQEIGAQDLKIIMQKLPKQVYEDCLKEERDLVKAVDKYFGKMCQHKVITLVKEIVF